MNFGWRIIGFAFVLRLLFLIGVPVEETREPHTLSAFNDERAHFNYVLQMAETNTRPIQTHSINESYPFGVYDFEYYQSPLWYKLAGIVYSVLPHPLKDIRAVRFFNILLGLMTILTIGRIMLLFSSLISAASMVFLSILGSNALFNSTVTNDSMLWLTASLVVYYGLSLMNSWNWKNLLGLTLCFSAAIWTKLSGLILLPAVVYTLYLSCPGRNTWSRAVIAAGWSVFSLLLTIPLFVQNHLYYGTIFPMSVGSGPARNILEGLAPKKLYLTVNYLVHSFYFPFENYWLGALQAIIFLVMGIVSLAVIYLGCRHFIVIISKGSDLEKRRIIFLGLTLICVMGGLLLMIFRYNQTEARHALAALPAVTFLLLKGGESVLGRYRGRLAIFAALFPAVPYLLFVAH